MPRHFLSCIILKYKGVTKLKRKGLLTVEVTFLMLVVLSVSALIIGLHLKLAYHNQLFEIIADAGEDAAHSIYAAGRFKASVLEDGKLLESSSIGILSQLIGTKLSFNVNNINQTTLQNLMNFNLVKSANTADQKQFIAKYNLAELPKFKFEFADNVMFISATLKYRTINPLSQLINYNPEIRHSIPLRRARTLVSGYNDKELASVFITDNGISSTRVYHTMQCFGMRFAKSKYNYAVEREMVGGDIELNGRNYTYCYFCKQNRK